MNASEHNQPDKTPFNLVKIALIGYVQGIFSEKLASLPSLLT